MKISISSQPETVRARVSAFSPATADAPDISELAAAVAELQSRVGELESRPDALPWKSVQFGRVLIYDADGGRASSLMHDGVAGNTRMYWVPFSEPFATPPAVLLSVARDTQPVRLAQPVYKSEDEMKNGFWLSVNYWDKSAVLNWLAVEMKDME